jgi:streptomycin 6-kinase
MLQLKHYLQKWHLSQPEHIAETHTSHVYKVVHADETVILKLLKNHADEEARAPYSLNHYAGLGVVRLLNHDEGAQLLEYVPGPDLVPHLQRKAYTESTEIICGVIDALHSRPADTSLPLPTVRRWFRSLFERAQNEASTDSIYVRGAKIAEDLLSSERDVRILHGDIHHENVRYSRRGWLSIDPKGIIGERTYDTANTLCNLLWRTDSLTNKALLSQHAELMARHLHIELPRLLAFTFAYSCLSASWSMDDGTQEDAQDALAVAQMAEALLNGS